MDQFEIDCRLTYEVDGPAHFLFHIEVANTAQQRTLTESLEIVRVQPRGLPSNQGRAERMPA